MFDIDTPAVIFKPGRFPLHHGTLGIIRSLGSVGVPVYAVLEDAWVPAGLSRYLTGKFVWSPDENADDGLLAGLAAIAKRIGRPAVIIPTSDHAAIFLEEHADSLAEWGLFPRNRPGLTRALADKRELYRLCEGTDLACPRSYFPNSVAEADAVAQDLEFPVVVKITEPWRRPRPPGIASTSIARSRNELGSMLQLIAGAPHLRLMVQEYIPAEGNIDHMFAAYCDKNSRCLVSLTGEKLRCYPADGGMTSASRSTDNEELRRPLEGFLEKIGYRGIVDIELRMSSRDGCYKLLDFNPRVGAQYRLYRNGAGIDVVQAMHLDLTGRTVPQTKDFKRRTFFVENYELSLMLKQPRPRRISWRDWFASLSGEREFAWFARHDVLPFFAMCLRMGYTLFRDRLFPPAGRIGVRDLKYRPGRGARRIRAGARLAPRPQ